MISYYSKFCGFLMLFLLAPMVLPAQTSGLSEAEFSLNTALSQRWKLNAGLGYRSLLTSDLSGNWNAKSRHIQASANVSYEVGFYGKVGGGAMYRNNQLFDDNSENELRLNQYYSWATYRNSFRWVQRFKIDERLQTSRTRFRLRYRLSLDVPLNGLELDTGEWYVLASTESLLNLSKQASAMWDQRITMGIGRQWTTNIKIQMEAEYRWEDYVNISERRAFLRFSCIYQL